MWQFLSSRLTAYDPYLVVSIILFAGVVAIAIEKLLRLYLLELRVGVEDMQSTAVSSSVSGGRHSKILQFIQRAKGEDQKSRRIDLWGSLNKDLHARGYCCAIGAFVVLIVGFLATLHGLWNIVESRKSHYVLFSDNVFDDALTASIAVFSFSVVLASILWVLQFALSRGLGLVYQKSKISMKIVESYMEKKEFVHIQDTALKGGRPKDFVEEVILESS